MPQIFGSHLWLRSCHKKRGRGNIWGLCDGNKCKNNKSEVWLYNPNVMVLITLGLSSNPDFTWFSDKSRMHLTLTARSKLVADELTLQQRFSCKVGDIQTMGATWVHMPKWKNTSIIWQVTKKVISKPMTLCETLTSIHPHYVSCFPHFLSLMQHCDHDRATGQCTDWELSGLQDRSWEPQSTLLPYDSICRSAGDESWTKWG